MPSWDPSILARWAGGEWRPAPPRAVTGVSHDTRQLRPGDLFFALPGARFDGHAFVEAAMRGGACGAVVARSRAPAATGGRVLLVVDDPLRALQAIAARHRSALPGTVIGIGGSTGKTTVKEMAAQMLATAMPTACSPGNWNNALGLPLSLLAMGPDHRAGVFEVGISHPGEMQPLGALLRPDWAVMTNVGPVHLAYFDSVRDIAREKGLLLAGLPVGGTAVLSRDGEWFELLRSMVGCRLVTVSLRAEADYCGRYDDLAGRLEVRERSRGEVVALRVPVPGAHNAANALAAAAVARGLGVPWDGVASALERYSAPPMRWESCAAGGATVINDAYNANPLSMRAALDAFRALPVAGRKWLALGAMLELGPTAPDEHVALGAYAASGPWEGLLVMGPLGARIADGAEGAGFAPERVVRGAGHADLAAALRERLRPGDTVLLKGSRAERLEEVLHALEEAARSGGPDARANAFRDPSGARTRACSTTFTC